MYRSPIQRAVDVRINEIVTNLGQRPVQNSDVLLLLQTIDALNSKLSVNQAYTVRTENALEEATGKIDELNDAIVELAAERDRLVTKRSTDALLAKEVPARVWTLTKHSAIGNNTFVQSFYTEGEARAHARKGDDVGFVPAAEVTEPETRKLFIVYTYTREDAHLRDAFGPFDRDQLEDFIGEHKHDEGICWDYAALSSGKEDETPPF